jgi:cation transport regulator ChaC
MAKDRILYFAYGSNMDISQMKLRCPDTDIDNIEIATLTGYRFIINSCGFATVIPDSSGAVHGVLWKITRDDENNLDICEGVKWGTYKKSGVDVESMSGCVVNALIYIAADNSRGKAKGKYMGKIVAAAEKHELPNEYLDEIKSWMPTSEYI